MSFFPLLLQRFQVERIRIAVSLDIIAISLLLGVLMAREERTLVFVGILGMAMLFLTLARPELATLAVSFALYSNLLVVASTFHGIPSIISGSFSFLLLIPFAAYVIEGRRGVIVTPALLFMFLYLAALFGSTLVAGTMTDSLTYITTFLTEGLILYFLFSNVIRTSTTLWRVVWVLLLAGGLVAGLTIYQELTRAYTNNFGGLAQIDQGLGFGVGENIFGKIRRQRAAGSVGEPNRYAQVLLVLVPFAFFLARRESRRLLRGLAVILGLVLVGGVLLTFSRGAAVALVGLLLLVAAWRYIHFKQLGLILLSLIVLILAIAPEYIIRINSIRGVQGFFSEESEDPDGAIRGRVTENLAAFYTFLDHPVLGVGPGVFSQDYSQRVGNSLGIEYLKSSRRAHNLYLEIAAETGVIGLGAFLAIVGWTLARLWSLRRASLTIRPDLADIATAFFLSITAYLLSGIFLHLAYQRYYWFLLAIANAAIYVLHRELTQDRHVEPSDAPPNVTTQSSLGGSNAPGIVRNT